MICCSILAAGLLAAGNACATPPVPMVWQFNAETLSRKQYLKDIDFIKANTLVDLLAVAPVDHVNPEDPDQFHDAFKEMVEYAKSKGIRVVLRQQPNMKGFFNASVDGGDAGTYVIEDQSEAQGIAYESEATLDAEGFASVTETAKWGRNKIRPLRDDALSGEDHGFACRRAACGAVPGRDRLHAAQHERRGRGEGAAVARTVLFRGAGRLVACEPQGRPEAPAVRDAVRAAG